MKKKKIFISHSTKDKAYAQAMVKLFEKIGVSSNDIFCTSVNQNGVEFNKNFIDEILNQFKEYELLMVYLLSKEYYSSPVSLNEMGAAWALDCEYILILLHGFDFPDIKGVVDPKKISLKMDDSVEIVQYRLDDIKNKLINEFELGKISDWQEIRGEFTNELNNIKKGKRKSAVIMKCPI